MSADRLDDLAKAGEAENSSMAARAAEQSWRVTQPDWTVEYDREDDAIRIRAPGRRPAVTYFLPTLPDVELLFERETGELVGLDIVNCKRVAKDHPEVRWMRRMLLTAQWTRRFPVLRRAAAIVRKGVRADARDEIQLHLHPGAGPA
ncbi:MAG TPA: hypothetical protein VGG07_14325 [Solirubrobacteraceae bacterium]|jgi:hypothetical protein